MGKISPSFSLPFDFLHLPVWGPVQDHIREVFDKALSSTFTLTIRVKGQYFHGLWTAIIGFLPVESFLHQEKLFLAARLYKEKSKTFRIFRGLLKDDGFLRVTL